jgi:hypothetical protein
MTTSKMFKGAAVGAGLAALVLTGTAAFAANQAMAAPGGRHAKAMQKCQAMGQAAMSNRKCERLMRKESRKMMKQHKKMTKSSS